MLIFLSCVNFFAQDNFLSYDEKIKHQVGIGLNNFIKSAFTADKNAYNIEYRYSLLPKLSLRSGFSYDANSGEDGFKQGGFKIGIDKNFKRYKSLSVYYGIDVMYKYTNFSSLSKNQHDFGAALIFGMQYNFSKHFSLSTEPILYFRRSIVIDNATFSKDNITKWNEYGLGKIGYIQLNFHF